MTGRTVDIEATGASESVLCLLPLTPAGRDWLAENVTAEPWQWLGDALAVEHRCGPDLLGAALADGLYVTLDEREPLEA